mgnify:CR=1 FL=1
MAIDQTTLSEEQPSPDVLRLLGGLESGEFYVPDESPYAGDWTDFGRMRRDRQRRKKFEEFDRSKGGPYATLPERFNLSELLPFGGFEKAVNRRDPLGVGFELASGVVPGGKAGIMSLAAIRNTPKIIRNMPKSVYKKHKIALETGKGGSRMGLDYFSHMDPTFALERILAPALGSLKKARKYEYAITSEGKHYFKHMETGRYKVIPGTRQEITKPQSLMLPDKRKKKVFKRRQDDVKKADWVKVRKQRLQVDDAADDLFQLRSRDIPDEVRAATLERYKEYPEAVKLEAMKILDDIGGPAGGAGAGLPSLLSKEAKPYMIASPVSRKFDKAFAQRNPTIVREVRDTPESFGIKLDVTELQKLSAKDAAIAKEVIKREKRADKRIPEIQEYLGSTEKRAVYRDIDANYKPYLDTVNKILNKP